MPDMIPVATMIKPPDPNQGLATLSSILGIRQAQQNLQTGALQQQGVAADVQQQQQRNREMQAAQQLSIQGVKGGKYTKEDGSLDRMRLSNDIASIGPYAQAMSGQLLSQANEVVANQQAHQNLTVSQKKEMGDTFASLAADPTVDNTKVIDAIEKLRQAHKDDPEYSRLLTSQIMHFPNQASPDQQRQILGRWSAAATGEPQTSAGTMDTGANIQPGGVNRFTGGFTPAGASIEKQLPPQIIPNPTTQGPAVVGGRYGTTPQPIGGGTTGPNTWQPYAGQQGDIKTYQGEVQGTRQAADSAPTARNINAQILRLADDAKTGPGTEVWQHAVGALAAPFGLSPTASYQELGKFLEKNAIQNMTSMGGPPSDARLSAAAAANGSTHFSPEALKAVTKFNDATNTALMEYRQGMDRAVGMGQNVDYTRLPAFKAAWAKNFDVDVFRVENAIRDGDKAELTKIRKDLGSKRLQELAQKSANLRLLEQGQIPNG